MSDTLKSWSIEKVTRLISGLLKKKHGNARVFSCTCATAAATARKDVTCEECEELKNGDIFIIEFTNAQTYNGAPTLQINSLGAKNIRRITGTNAGRYEWSTGETLTFRYNGSHFIISNAGLATTTYYGRTKLYTGAASTSAALALTPASLNTFANETVCPYYSTSKTYEVGDKVRYGNYIYQCINAIPTAQAWTAANWEIAPTLQEQITDLTGADILGMSVSKLVSATSPSIVGMTCEQLIRQ